MTVSNHPPLPALPIRDARGAVLAGAAALLLSACAGMAPGGADTGPAAAATDAATTAAVPAKGSEDAKAGAHAPVAAALDPIVGAGAGLDGGLQAPDTPTFFSLPMSGENAGQSALELPSAPFARFGTTPGASVADGPSIRFRRRSPVPREDAPEPDEANEGLEIGRGTASWYGLQFHGRRTANGERYNMYDLTAAHKSLPFNTIVSVKSLQTGRTVRVRINDRGPYVDGRVIDLSKAAADELGMTDVGIRPVSLTVEEWPDGTVPEAGAARQPGTKGAKATRKRTHAHSRH